MMDAVNRAAAAYLLNIMFQLIISFVAMFQLIIEQLHAMKKNAIHQVDNKFTGKLASK